MTKKTIIIAIVIIVILVGAVWALKGSSTSVAPANTAANSQQVVATPAVNASAITKVATPTKTPLPDLGMSASSDSSTDAITKDAAAIDTQLGNLTTDSASLDQSLVQ